MNVMTASNVAQGLEQEAANLLQTIEKQLGIVADISRADILLYTLLADNKVLVQAHAHPHSVAPAYLANYRGQVVSLEQLPVVTKVVSQKRRRRGTQSPFGNETKVSSEGWPIFCPVNPLKVIGVVSIDTSLFEVERLRRRSKVFRHALHQLQTMLIEGLVKETEVLTPFGEHEGIIVVDPTGLIRYASGVATNLYRRLGIEGLEGRSLENLHTRDDQMARQAMHTLACVEREVRDEGRDWTRKAIPLLGNPSFSTNLRQLFRRSGLPDQLTGVLLTLRDVTEERRQEQELRVKNAMIKEIHHRVKNNLQTIAALLRIQARRIAEPGAEAALKDATNRILSIAVIHEFLSDNEAWTINIKEVSQRIITQLEQGLVDPEIDIKFSLAGPSIWVPSRQATAAALVINELLQNAVEHGFEHRTQGVIATELHDEGDHIIITIDDDGRGLPPDFDVTQPGSLGLQIARTLATEDLQGTLDLIDVAGGGTTAKITFPKALFEDEETSFS